MKHLGVELEFRYESTDQPVRINKTAKGRPEEAQIRQQASFGGAL